MRRMLFVLFFAVPLLAQPSGVGGGGAADQFVRTTFSKLGTPGASRVRYCTNCNEGTFPCTGGAGTGAFAFRVGSAWVCPTLSAVPSVGSVAWGAITGTLSNQTDLQNALNLKAPLASPLFTGQPTIPDFTLSPHTHLNAAGGGTLSEAALATTDVTTNNVSITKHGFAPKAPNDATKFLDGTGVFSTPAGGGSAPFADDVTSALVKGTADATKLFGINVAGLTTGNHPVLVLSGTTTAPIYGLGNTGVIGFGGGNTIGFSNGTGPTWIDASSGVPFTFDTSGITNPRTVIPQDANGTMALTSNNLGAFANTTSAQLAAKITNETGTNFLVFNTSPTINTPTISGHVTTSGTAPSLSSCGTSPSIAGNDAAGRVTIGSGVTTTCVLTFDAAWSTAPTCFANDETSILSVQSVATTTALTINAGSALTSNVINYRCVGY